jgi:hypothetical protein
MQLVENGQTRALRCKLRMLKKATLHGEDIFPGTVRLRRKDLSKYSVVREVLSIIAGY